jgi:hypothetical protein
MLRINLTGLKDPGRFVHEMQERYPDGNVHLHLDGHTMLVDIAEVVQPQIRVTIFSFLEERAREAIYGSRQHH